MNPEVVPEANTRIPTADMEAVTELLGRVPNGYFTVIKRRPNGSPMVIANDPLLRDGTPMPTRFWLLDPDINAALGTLESTGGVKRAEAIVDAEELARAHERYGLERGALVPPDWAGARPHDGVGGTRRGVKCLHAHVAWWLVGGDDPVGRWASQEIGLRSDGAFTS